MFASPVTGRSDLYEYVIASRTLRRVTSDTAYEADGAYSADGEWIAFTREDEDYIGHIWIMRSDGTRARQLTRGPLYDSNPAFSPDGKTIAFIRKEDRPGDWEIFTIRAEGSGETRITDNAEEDWDPVFYRSSRSLVYARDRHGIVRQDLDSMSEELLLPNGVDPKFSHDWETMVYVSGDLANELCVADATGKNPRVLEAKFRYQRPVFLPDDNSIVVTIYQENSIVIRRYDLKSGSAKDLVSVTRLVPL